MKKLAILGLAAGLAAAGGCDDETTTGTEINAEGTVVGVVWLDRNGNTRLDPSDAPVREVRVELLAGPGTEPVFTARSRPNGDFFITGVPVGDYRVRVDSATAGDSVRVLRIDSVNVTVTQSDTAAVSVGFTYPTLPVDTARQEPIGTRLFVEGLALNRWGTFADSTVHVRDSSGTVRAVRVPPVAVSAGDSVRVQGIVSIRTGQTVLQNGPLFVIRAGVESPAPDTVQAATAAAADGGRLDAGLVHLDSVVVQDTTISAFGESILTVEDASGTAEVLFDRDVGFVLSFPGDIIGTILDVTGVLVPSGTPGSWLLKPRRNSDVTVGPLSYPVLPVTDARAESPGTRVQLEGLALNRWNAFGDSTLHVRDTTGAIRSLRVRPVAAAPGDSVRLLGTVATVNTQPVLRDVRTTVLEKGLGSPDPVSVTALAARQAGAGSLDADLVRLDSVVIRDTTRNAQGEFVFVVGDASGTARVVLDANVSFPLSFSVDVIGTILDVTGVLVPTAGGTDWVIKPRRADDILVGPLSYPTVPVDTARQEPPETRLIVEGLALNAWNVYGDSTLHVADSTGAIRALRVLPVAIAAGDSIRVVGTTTTAFNQPVLRDTRTTVLQTGVVSPPADSIGTAAARNAATGSLDAALARIAGAVVQSTGQTADNDVILTVDDGSGPVDVVLDRQITFFIDLTTVVGQTLDATGLLVPSRTTTGVWVLKPRRNADVAVN